MKQQMDCYEYANYINKVKPGDALYNSTVEATKAATIMKNLKFCGYNEYGQEVYEVDL